MTAPLPFSENFTGKCFTCGGDLDTGGYCWQCPPKAITTTAAPDPGNTPLVVVAPVLPPPGEEETDGRLIGRAFTYLLTAYKHDPVTEQFRQQIEGRLTALRRTVAEKEKEWDAQAKRADAILDAWYSSEQKMRLETIRECMGQLCFECSCGLKPEPRENPYLFGAVKQDWYHPESGWCQATKLRVLLDSPRASSPAAATVSEQMVERMISVAGLEGLHPNRIRVGLTAALAVPSPGAATSQDTPEARDAQVRAAAIEECIHRLCWRCRAGEKFNPSAHASHGHGMDCPCYAAGLHAMRLATLAPPGPGRTDAVRGSA